MIQKHIGRDSPGEINGPVSGAKIDRMIQSVLPIETTSDAADGAADPRMRFIWGYGGIGRRVGLKIRW